jgi:hypothetical protein
MFPVQWLLFQLGGKKARTIGIAFAGGIAVMTLRSF